MPALSRAGHKGDGERLYSAFARLNGN